MSSDRASGLLARLNPFRRFWIWSPDLWDGFEDKPEAERWQCGQAWASSSSPSERCAGLTVLATMDRDEALHPLLNGLNDEDKQVRALAFMNLLWHDAPPDHRDRIVAHLGGEARTAQRWVSEPWPPGALESLGLARRLLPHLEKIARTSNRRRCRLRASRYVQRLRHSPPAGAPIGEE
jgi:hypothetical protein